MTWLSKGKRVHRRLSRTIGLNVRGRPDPDLYHVCEDVYTIVEKMVDANKAIGSFSRHPRFEFEEVLFVLSLLGAEVPEVNEHVYSMVDLWITEG